MSEREHRAERVPDLLVEKLALDELPAARAAALRERLGVSAQARLEAIERSNAEILREHPPEEVAAAVRRRLARLDDAPARGRAGWMMWAPIAAAAAVMLVWVVNRDGEAPAGGGATDGPELIATADPPRVPVGDDGAPPEQIFLKGDPVLAIDKLRDGRLQRMDASALVAAGDQLQLSYNAKGAQQGVVVSIDGAGVATLHFPASEDDAPKLAHGGPVPLPESYELDDAPGFERFFFVTVDAGEPRLDVARVMEAARELAASEAASDGELGLPRAWRQQSLLLRK